MKRLSDLLVIGSLLLSPAALAFPPHPAQPPEPASSASGDGYWDFRFGAGAEPMLTDSEYDLDDGSPTYDWEWEAPGGSVEFNAAHRFDSRGPSSAYMSFGVFLRGFGGPDDPDSGTEVSVGMGGVQVGGGWSYRPNNRYSLEIGPRIGVGTASATEEFNGGGGELESDTGGYVRFDVGAANLFNLGKVQLGVTVGIASWAATIPYEAQFVNTSGGPAYFPGGDVTYSGSGGYLNFSFGFR